MTCDNYVYITRCKLIIICHYTVKEEIKFFYRQICHLSEGMKCIIFTIRYNVHMSLRYVSNIFLVVNVTVSFKFLLNLFQETYLIHKWFYFQKLFPLAYLIFQSLWLRPWLYTILCHRMAKMAIKRFEF